METSRTRKRIQCCMSYFVYCMVLLMITSAGTWAAPGRWNPKTTDWSQNPNPVVGDWGFNRPGYPAGLYIHGVTVPDGEPVTNPVIYDNDIVDDVLEDEWAFVMADLGHMNLVGYICTPALTDGWGFYHPEWKQEFYNMYNRASNSGMCMDRIPPVTIGTEASSESAGVCKWSEGAQLYVDTINQQYQSDPTRPVIINIGGQGATLASAYCIDNSIVDKCIVYYTALSGYNGHYTWASELVAQHYLVINFGQESPWWNDTNAQNQWNVLPRPTGTGCPTNADNSGEWANINHGVSVMDFFIDQMQHKCWYYPTACGGCLGHAGGQCSDGYFDGTFLHAWAPGFITNAEINNRRGGDILQVKGFSESAAKAITFPYLSDAGAFDGQCPAELDAPQIDSLSAPESNTVNITWIDNSHDPQEDGFTVQRKPYNGLNDWADVATVGQGVTTYTDTDNLHGLVEYTYRIVAFKN